jgi:hypothetical protein
MKFRLFILFAVCTTLYNCKNKPSNTIQNHILEYENECYKVKITEVNKNDLTSFKNMYHNEPFLGIKAECISLKELLGIIKNVDTSAIVLKNKDFKNKYYSAFIDQKLRNKSQESIIANSLIDAFKIEVYKSFFEIDTVITSINNKAKYLKHIHQIDRKIGDTIKTEYRCSNNLKIFKNYKLEDILSVLNKEFDNHIVLKNKESKRINIELKGRDWNSTKAELESNLGLTFNTLNSSQKEKYLVMKKL